MYRVIMCAAAGALCLITTTVLADETLRFRYIAHRIAVAPAQEVGDADAHTMAIFRNSGLASFPDQSVATLSWIGTNDYVKGVGPFVAYFNLSFSDGSILWYKGTGSAKLDGTKPVFTGVLSVLGGKGRFQGAKGDGTISGMVVNTDGDQYGDHVINVKK
jgi:hypothetical protein